MERRVAFLDLKISEDRARQELLAAVDAVLRHGRIVMGPEVAELESQVATYCNRKHAVGVNSGTDALFLALKALGIGPGHEVITTALSWVATANAIALTGATPIFADIGDDLNIDPGSIPALITPRTKAIMPVHYTGKICRMDELAHVAQAHGLPVVEDASQAFGATWRGRRSGSFGRLACFSMNPMKLFAACGEAGMVLTDEQDVYERLVALRYNGTVNREVCIEPSLNGRLDTLQAAILLRRLPGVEHVIRRRREIAAWYSTRLAGLVTVPCEAEGECDVYYTYTIRTPRRDELKTFLEGKGIETKIQHPALMPQQPAYRDRVHNAFPRAADLVKQVLCIPVHEKLEADELEYVVACIREFFAG